MTAYTSAQSGLAASRIYRWCKAIALTANRGGDLGRLDALKESGKFDRLLRSGARFTESGMLLSALEKGETTTIEAKRIGPSLLFESLWRDSFCRPVIEGLLADRKFEFPVERAVFLTVPHRIMDPGSDRAAEKWRSAYSISGMDAIDPHHLYRAMAWLDDELADQQGRGLVPRTNKDLIEEHARPQRSFEGFPTRSASDGPR
jgi:hypothetical protein